MDVVYLTFGILCGLCLLSFLLCLYWKRNDLKLQRYLVYLAKRKGVKLNLDQIKSSKPLTRADYSQENCTIIVPEVAIVL